MLHIRKHVRLRNYDYSSPGDYFITMNTKNRVHFFGEIISPDNNSFSIGLNHEKEMLLNDIGSRVQACLQELSQHFCDAEVDEFIVMPDHVHLNLTLKKPSASNSILVQKEFKNNQFSRPVAGSVSVIIQQFKAEVNRWCGKNGFEEFQWQPRFYDCLIRDYDEFARVKNYIKENPSNWGKRKRI